mmetsp:Transcript_40046/g.48804  ORF Transcript_40046/g.48804 Transcript_40046/m.48804 type:complete len:86 (+) Transcript_40046:29-286(+)
MRKDEVVVGGGAVLLAEVFVAPGAERGWDCYHPRFNPPSVESSYYLPPYPSYSYPSPTCKRRHNATTPTTKDTLPPRSKNRSDHR